MDMVAGEFDVVDESAQFFAPVSTDLISEKVAQYGAKRKQIEEVVKFMDGTAAGVLHYFLSSNSVAERRGGFGATADLLFKRDGALGALNSAYWQELLSLTDVRDYMPQARRAEWDKTIIEQTAPDFEEETVRATIGGLLSMRGQFLAERVDGIFRGLSGEHVTNAPEAFGKRMILTCGLSYERKGLVNDLRCVVAKFMGRDEPKWRASDSLESVLKRNYGEWMSIDGGAMRIKLYKKGTVHIEVHPDMAWRLNCILAQLHPLAIPAEFRQKPKRKAKEFVMMGRPLPFSVVGLIGGMRSASRRLSTDWPERFEQIPRALRFDGVGTDKAVEQQAREALEALGAVYIARGSYFQFDYEPRAVLDRVIASGCLPDEKSHQFYPTPADLAGRVVDGADIDETHDVLEPQAGRGGLADLLPKDRTTCVEIAPLNCDVLRAKGFAVEQADFLQWADTTAKRFDRIVMNPPFSENRWKAHTLAALGLLKPGGRVDAILPASCKGAFDDTGCDVSYSEQISDAFPGVGVTVYIVTLQAPE